MITLPPNAQLVLPTLKEAIREQERLRAVWLQDEVNDLNTKMVAELTASVNAHKAMSEYITHNVTSSVDERLAILPNLTQGDDDYEIDN